MPFLALYPEAALMAFDNFTGDVEANAEAWIGFFGWFVDLVEALENLFVIGLVDANAEVLYAEVGVGFISDDLYNYVVSIW